MAVQNITVYDRANDGMALPLSITRGNPNPLDDTYLYATLADAQAYATSGATAYVGQTICVLNTDVANGVPTVYVIKDTNGTLKAVGDTADVFSATEWTDLIDRVDILDNTDESVEGSVAYALDQSKISVVLDPAVTSGTSYDIYQGYTYSQVQDTDALGNPIVDSDSNPVYKTVKTPNKIGSIGINQDLFVNDGSVTSIIESLDSDNNKIQASDDDGNLLFESDGTTPIYKKEDAEGNPVSYNLPLGTYLKLVLSNNNPVYIPTSSLAKGLVTAIKTATHTYSPDKDGVIDMSADLSTDDIIPGTLDTWIMNGGDATTL